MKPYLVLVLLLLVGCVQPGYRLEVLNPPSAVAVGQPFTFQWELTGAAAMIPHTAIHYDFISHPSSFGLDMTPEASGYKYKTLDFAQGDYAIPRTFSYLVELDMSGTLHYRAHAVINGQHYWTEEFSVPVSGEGIMLEDDQMDAALAELEALETLA